MIPFPQYNTAHHLRSPKYKPYYVLCKLNTKCCVGWMVCPFVLSLTCKLTSGLFRYNTISGGTSRFERHIKMHKKPSKSSLISIKKHLRPSERGSIAKAAAMAVAYDFRPISFTDNKPGIVNFAKVIFEAGQSFPISDVVDPDSILPCAKTVGLALSELSVKLVNEFRNKKLPAFVQIGGALTTDGVSIKMQDRQFYDLTLHVIRVIEHESVDKRVSFELVNKTLILHEKPDNGSASHIRTMISEELQRRYFMTLDDFQKSFTMVTDCAAVMARVANSSVSENVSPMSQKWLGCIVHQINTALKSCINSIEGHVDLYRVRSDLDSVKRIVQAFKKSFLNGQLPSGYHLIQEVETRFGTTFMAVQRFLKCSSLVKQLLMTHNLHSANMAFSSLLSFNNQNGASVSYPALEAVVDAMKPVISMQTQLQASKEPTMHIVLILMQNCFDHLDRISNGGSVQRGSDFVPAPELSRKLCISLKEWMEAKIRIHDLMLVGTFLNPLYREFQFIPSHEKREEYKGRAMRMTRCLISDATNSSNSISSSDVPFTTSREVPTRSTSERNHTTNHNSSLVSVLESYTDSHFIPVEQGDEVSKYSFLNIGNLGINRADFLSDPFSCIRFWHTHKGAFPNIFKVALRVYATPVSSCASERVFRAVNRIVTRDRAGLNMTTLEDIILVRSLGDANYALDDDNCS